jgi:hypothetical protein
MDPQHWKKDVDLTRIGYTNGDIHKKKFLLYWIVSGSTALVGTGEDNSGICIPICKKCRIWISTTWLTR